MEIRQLKAFATVAHGGSFSRAAEVLSYAQSSVSAQIQLLEEELGTRLFERLGRRIALTQEGNRLLVYAEQILQLAAEAGEAVGGSGGPRGILRIGAPESLSITRLPPLLQEYGRRNPEVELVLRMGCPVDFSKWLGDNTIDIAFIINREIANPFLTRENLVPEPMVLVAAPGHPVTDKAPLGPSGLAGESLILTETGCYRDVLERMLADAGVQPGSILELGSIEAIRQLVARGLGTTVLPRVVVEQDLASGRLVDLGWEGPDFRIVTQIAYHKDKWLSPALRAIMELAREMIGEGPAAPTDRASQETASFGSRKTGSREEMWNDPAIGPR